MFYLIFVVITENRAQNYKKIAKQIINLVNYLIFNEKKMADINVCLPSVMCV